MAKLNSIKFPNDDMIYEIEDKNAIHTPQDATKIGLFRAFEGKPQYSIDNGQTWIEIGGSNRNKYKTDVIIDDENYAKVYYHNNYSYISREMNLTEIVIKNTLWQIDNIPYVCNEIKLPIINNGDIGYAAGLLFQVTGTNMENLQMTNIVKICAIEAKFDQYTGRLKLTFATIDGKVIPLTGFNHGEIICYIEE